MFSESTLAPLTASHPHPRPMSTSCDLNGGEGSGNAAQEIWAVRVPGRGFTVVAAPDTQRRGHDPVIERVFWFGGSLRQVTFVAVSQPKRGSPEE